MRIKAALLVVIALATTLGSAVETAPRPRPATGQTHFNWERVPLNIHFGKRNGDLTDAEITFLATNSVLVTLEKGHGAGAHGSTEAGVADTANHVGKILDTLDRNGLASNTLVMFSSDNGPESRNPKDGERRPGTWGSQHSIGETGGLRGRKRSLFEGGVRVPFIVRWPAQMPAGVKNDTTVLCAVDLLPTFCAAAGVTPPSDARGDGENLLPAFQGKAVCRTRLIFWLHKGKSAEPDWWPRLAVRDGKWKLLTTFDGARTELHDLTTNRAEDAAKDQSKQQPEIAARLIKLALDWYATLPTEANPECVSSTRGDDPTKRRKTTEPPGQPAKKPKTDRNIPFDRWDTNKDGVLTLDEYQAGLKGQEGLEARFKNFDKDGDGKLTREEFVGPANQ